MTIHTRLHKVRELWKEEQVYVTAPSGGGKALPFFDVGLDLPTLGKAIDDLYTLPKFSVQRELMDIAMTDEYHKSFLDMKRAGVLRLPYPAMLIEFHSVAGGVVVLLVDHKSDDHYKAALEDGWEFSGLVMRVHHDDDGEYLVVSPSMSYLTISEVDGKPWIKMGANTVAYMGKDHKVVEDTWMKDASSVGQALFAALLLMVTQGVERKVIECDKLNRKRAASGKPPIPRHTYIYIGHVYRSADGEARDAYDPRRSPKPHWRRGHVKSVWYGPGRSKIKTVFIKPRLVAYKEASVFTESPIPEYVVGM